MHDFVSSLQPDVGRGFLHVSNVFLFFNCDQAALRTLQSVCLFVRLSVRLLHLFHLVAVIVSSQNFQELLPLTRVMSMQKVKVKGQGHRGLDPT